MAKTGHPGLAACSSLYLARHTGLEWLPQNTREHMNPQKIDIRWLIRRDLEAIVEIEQLSFQSPWTEAEFLSALRDRTIIGRVIEVNGTVQGFLISQMHKHHFDVINMAVRPSERRKGYGTSLLERLERQLDPHGKRRRYIEASLKAENEAANNFFRKLGYRAYRFKRHYYECGSDAVVMRRCVFAVDKQNQGESQ